LGEAEQRAYLAAVMALLPPVSAAPPVAFAYSALCGVGSRITRQLTHELGATLYEVSSQASARTDFGGLASPNPEHSAALEEVRALAEREQLDLAFAHDPDADRLAVLVRLPGEGLRALSGDEVGALVGDFLLREHPAPATTLLASTLVSGGLLERIALAHGARFVRSATGFKWIAALGRESAQSEGRELLFGYEEALGYAFFAMADDKDGIAALAVICRLAQHLLAEGRSLAQRLAELALAHGLFVTRQLTVSLQGNEGAARLARSLQRLRALPAEQLLGAGARKSDYEREPLRIPLLVFEALDARVCVRPSGTEPKLKLYLHVREPVQDGADLAPARVRAGARLDALENALRPLLAP
jgi:phosphomannomutase